MGRVLATEDDNWPSVVHNLRRVRQKWARLTHILIRGGSGCPDIRTDLLGGGAIGTSVRVRYMGPDAAYDEGIGRISPQGRPQSDGKAAVEGAGHRLGLPPYGGCLPVD